ncbi:cytochrome c biogenesis protein CcdA [Alsobacter sp. KACC 23698]|uniref:Cytochrome c biogenesis protein CcdA n=1 Tax=Alsobacter sp. KACC 23698 TaxID=3149229 RepID=A0AAU7JAA2_9HYPH
MADVTYPAAVAAGLLSFLSPCVLPLVPPYLCFMAGTTIEDLAEEGEKAAKRDVMLASCLFVLGFATVFVALGATASVLGQVIRQYSQTLSLVAGGAIVLMGLHFLGVFRLTMLYREARVKVEKPVGLWGAYVMGLAFAFGWTPCIGPVLAAILAVAGSEDTVLRGATLLAFYSAGLGIPFLLAAMALGPFAHFMRRFRRRMGVVEKAMGVLLVATGVAFLTGSFTQISFWLLETFPALGRLG